jgi:hypothetical protein
MGRADAFTGPHLLLTAPPELIRATNKTLAMLHRPGRGGAVRIMQGINDSAPIEAASA